MSKDKQSAQSSSRGSSFPSPVSIIKFLAYSALLLNPFARAACTLGLQKNGEGDPIPLIDCQGEDIQTLDPGPFPSLVSSVLHMRDPETGSLRCRATMGTYKGGKQVKTDVFIDSNCQDNGYKVYGYGNSPDSQEAGVLITKLPLPSSKAGLKELPKREDGWVHSSIIMNRPSPCPAGSPAGSWTEKSQQPQPSPGAGVGGGV